MLELREWGDKLMNEQPNHKGEIQRTLRRLQNVEHQLRVAGDTKGRELTRARNWQLFSERANRAEQWLASKELFLKQVQNLFFKIFNGVSSVSGILSKFCIFVFYRVVWERSLTQ